MNTKEDFGALMAVVAALMFVLLYLLFCHRVGKYFRHNRGRSYAAGFFLALVFSPLVAWIFGMILPQNAEALASQGLVNGSMKKCPSCAELVKAEAMKCRHCGEALTATVAA